MKTESIEGVLANAGMTSAGVKMIDVFSIEDCLVRAIEIPAGGGNKPHYHRSHSEVYHILSGEMELVEADLKNPDKKEVKKLKQGDFVKSRPNVLHYFHNSGSTRLVFTSTSHKTCGNEDLNFLADV